MRWYACWKSCIPKNIGRMGLCDLYSFNLAMLAKHVLLLVEDPDSIFAQVLRAKYYPHGEILKAWPTNGSSFIWKSLVVIVQTFKHGYISHI